MKKFAVFLVTFAIIASFNNNIAKAQFNPDNQTIVDLGNDDLDQSDSIPQNPDFAWFTPDLQVKTEVNIDPIEQQTLLLKQIKLGLLIFSKAFLQN